MAPDPDDDPLALRLFEAARRERPEPGVKQGALRPASAQTRSLSKQRWLLAALAMGAAGVLFVVGQGFESGPAGLGPEADASGIRAEPIQAHSRSIESASKPREVVPRRKEATESPVSPPVTAAPPSSAPRGAAAPSSGAPARSATPKLSPASLERELELLDAARQALLGGDTSAAQARLAQYDKVATRRHLGAEATVLRMQILAAEGRTSEASALASEFVAKHPNSPLVDRAKSFVQSSPRGSIQEGVGP